MCAHHGAPATYLHSICKDPDFSSYWSAYGYLLVLGQHALDRIEQPCRGRMVDLCVQPVNAAIGRGV